jgi:hypothetical protein
MATGSTTGASARPSTAQAKALVGLRAAARPKSSAASVERESARARTDSTEVSASRAIASIARARTVR